MLTLLLFYADGSTSIRAHDDDNITDLARLYGAVSAEILSYRPM